MLDTWGHTHTHTHRIFNTYCYHGKNSYANAPQCYTCIACIVKDTSVTDTSSSVQNCAVSPSRRQFQPFLSTSSTLTVFQKKQLKIRLQPQLNIWMNECCCWGPRLSYGALCCLWVATAPSVDWLDSRDWIPIRRGDSLFIVSTKSVGSLHLSYPTDSGAVSRSIKRSEPTVHLVSKYKMEIYWQTDRHPLSL